MKLKSEQQLEQSSFYGHHIPSQMCFPSAMSYFYKVTTWITYFGLCKIWVSIYSHKPSLLKGEEWVTSDYSIALHDKMQLCNIWNKYPPYRIIAHSEWTTVR